MSLESTLMLDLRSEYMNRYDKYEQRASRYGALRLFQADSQNPSRIFDEETIANIALAYNRSVVVPVLDQQTIASTTPFTRSCVVIDNENNSSLIVLTFSSFGFGFSMVPAINDENDVKYTTDWQRKMTKFVRQMASDLDTLCLSTLEADKNVFWTGLTDFYAQVGDALQVPNADKDNFYNTAESIMSQIDYFDGVNIVANHYHMPIVRRLDNQGAGNANNEAFQFTGAGSSDDGKNLRPYSFYPTNRLANGLSVQSTGFLVNDGSTFIMSQQDPDAKAGRQVGGGSKRWSIQEVPEIEMPMSLLYQEDCGDNTAKAGASSAGLEGSYLEGWTFSTNIITATAYVSTPASQYAPIVKFEILD